MNQRVHKSSAWHPPVRAKGSQLAPRPFAVPAQQGSHRPPRFGHNFADSPVHARQHASVAQRRNQEQRPNQTGLPDGLKSGIESLSGVSLDKVKVHYNSSRPAQFDAVAHTQGSNIHVAPGQEEHLPHEAWHVVQQAQGRVQPTMQMKGGPRVNDNAGLEHEADVMGARALGHAAQLQDAPARQKRVQSAPAQRVAPKDAPIQAKWIIRRGQRVEVANNYELQPGESTPEGLRRRVIPRPSTPPVAAATPQQRQPSASLGQLLGQAGSFAGYASSAASAAEYVHGNPISEFLQHVPVLGVASAANTAVNKRQQSENAYVRGDLTGAARHGLGALASGVKSAADTTTVLTGGLSAPVTVPVSAAMSAVNTVTSLPEHAQSAASVIRDPRETAARGLDATASAHSALRSVASTISNSSRAAWNYLSGAAPEPPQSKEQRRQQEERERLERARAQADDPIRRKAKSVRGKL